MKTIYSIIIFLLLFCGCSFFSSQKVVSSEASKFVLSGKVVDEQRLSQGGNILALPFDAGDQVLINDEFDNASLMVLGGIFDIISGEEGRDLEFDGTGQVVVVGNDNRFSNQRKREKLKLYFSENVEDINFLLDGRIVVMEGGPDERTWFGLRRNRTKLSVEGELIDSQTGKVVVFFEDVIERDEGVSFSIIAREVGHNIGKLILSGI